MYQVDTILQLQELFHTKRTVSSRSTLPARWVDARTLAFEGWATELHVRESRSICAGLI